MKAQIDVTNIRIETERLILRPWNMADLEDFHEYCSDPIVGPMAGWEPYKTLEESREVLENFIREPIVFALEWKDSGKAIGSLGIDWLDPDPELQNAGVLILSYDLHRDYWGRGLMPEAVNAIKSYCFDVLNADYLHIGALQKNRQSQRVAEKCGFRFWKEWDYHFRNGTVEIERVYLLPNPNREVGL